MSHFSRRRILACAVALAAGLLGAYAASRNKADEQPLATIAFGSCAHQGRAQDFWEPIVDSRPDLFIFAGDNIYADTFDSDLKWKKYQELAHQPGFKKLQKTCPIIATWDDHDYGLNDSGADYPMKEESERLFLDFWGVPPDSPRRKQAGVYSAEIYGPPGKRVQVILLDTRYFRSPLKLLATRKPGGGKYRANRSKNATMLGDEQWAWLEKQLRKPAEIRLLVSSIELLAQDHDWECWMNFPAERARLFDLIKSTGAEGLIVLSGDRHFAELSKMPRGPGGYPLYDVTSSGLNMTYEGMGYEPNRWRVGKIFKPCNFGLVFVDWDQPDPAIRLEVRSVKGKTVIARSLTLSQLRRPRDD